MGVINKIEVKNVEYDVEDLKAQEKLAELEDRLDEGVGGVADLMLEITWSDLKTLRDNSELVPGMKYRITDYVTTTVQAETKSANHPFDIIVEAVSENQLSELAQAIQHEGDTYFEGNDLGAWQLWYDLDNNTNKYAWADEVNGKGVIYRMIDEKRNDCPYDFKNILFYNIKYTSNTTSDKYYYTFSYVVQKVLYDGTVEKQVTGCHSNSIGVYKTGGRRQLNKNTWQNTAFSNYCYSNSFGNYCNYNSFGNYCYSNSLGNNCYSNSFGNYCYSNSFGNYCNSNSLGNSCNYNSFGNSCYSNSLGNYCNYNSFGDYCSDRQLNASKISITLNEDYYDDGSGALVPVKHPDLSTQPSILPYKFMGQYVYEQLIPITPESRVQPIVDLAIDKPAFLSASTLGLGATSNIDILAISDDNKYILLKESLPNIHKFIKITYTDASQLVGGGEGYYGYGNINTTVESLYDFGIINNSLWIYEKTTDTLILDALGKLDRSKIPSTYLGSKNIIIGDKVTSIGYGAFRDCTGLTNVEIGNGVTSIGNDAFYYCKGLTSVVIGNSVTIIGNKAFQYCSGLTSVVIPNSVTSIGFQAFEGCSGLTSIEIPNSVTSIGNDAFFNCSGLTAVHISDLAAWCGIDFGKSTVYANPLYYAKNLYLNGEKLTELIIPDGIVEIKYFTFYNCTGLTSIEIPNSVTSIRDYAFSGCSGITSVVCKAVTPPSCSSASFNGVSKSMPLYVPEESVSAYKTAPYWKEFTNIQAINE